MTIPFSLAFVHTVPTSLEYILLCLLGEETLLQLLPLYWADDELAVPTPQCATKSGLYGFGAVGATRFGGVKRLGLAMVIVLLV